MRIQGFDHVECYVGDLEASVALLHSAYGFRVAGQQSPTAAAAGLRSTLLRQGQIDLLLTCATRADHAAAEYVRPYRRPDGSLLAYNHDTVVRQAAGGGPDYADPEFCPVLWQA